MPNRWRRDSFRGHVVVSKSGPTTVEVIGPAVGVDEAAVIARAQRDLSAFAPLYQHYALPVFQYCHRLLGSREAAEDATSLVFANALAALPRYRAGEEGTFRSWLFVIAHNVVTNSARAQRMHAPVELTEVHADHAPSPEQMALEEDERRSLRAMLDRLPNEQRRVAELRLAGLTGAEIALALNRSHPAVRMLQMRAVTRLRELFNGDAGEGVRSRG